MPCYRPLKGYRSKERTENGKRSIVFKPDEGFIDMPVNVPCGQCIGCRLERSRQWAMRCVHEASQHEDNAFLTLTYDPVHYPADRSLDKRHFQKFMKRLRKAHGSKIKYFHCGEYGTHSRRAHYHAIVFGYFPEDAKHLGHGKRGDKLFTSERLNRIWGKGFVIVGSVSFESAAYVARYCTKKITISDATKEEYEKDYIEFDPLTGVFYELLPEYATMSNGLGTSFLEKYKDEIYPSDFITVRGVKQRPPRFYDKYMEDNYPEIALAVKAARRVEQEKNKEENTDERLWKKETVKKAQLTMCTRD